MAEAMMERPDERNPQTEQTNPDEAGEGSRELIREALTQAGVEPVKVDWEGRRMKMLGMLRTLEFRIDQDLARLNSR